MTTWSCVHHGEQRQAIAIQNSHWCNSALLWSRGDSGFYLVRREKVQQLADFIVEQRLPLKAGPGHTVLPAPWTFPSGFPVLQAVPHTLKDLQGLSVPLAQSPINKPCIAVGGKKQISPNDPSSVILFF